MFFWLKFSIMERNWPNNDQAVNGGEEYEPTPQILYLANHLSLFYADFILCCNDYHGSLHGEM